PIESLVDTVAAIPPLQQGDLAALGLCNWTPAGMVQYSFEAVHLLTGLPWFWTFVAATVLWRSAIFPFAVAGMQNASRMRPIQGPMREAGQRMHEARRAGDTAAIQRVSLEMAQMRQEAGVSMWGMVAGPLVQLPVSFGMFIGIKNMCELPVIQLTQSGFAWLPDLTQPSPYYILPILLAASGNGLLMLSARDADLSNPTIAHLMNAMRVLSVAAIYWMESFPSGLLLTLLVTSLFTIGQILVLRAPAARRLFQLPPIIRGNESRLPPLRDSLRYYLGQPQPVAPKK
ncbi:60Kd inner membrane protein-domain-containing protein, partial [Mycena amicta]